MENSQKLLLIQCSESGGTRQFEHPSTKASARSARTLNRALARSRKATLAAREFFSLGNGACFFYYSPCSSPLSRCLRQTVRLKEHSPSRRKRAPISPEPVQASVSRRIRNLYSAVYRRRVCFAVAFTSEGDYGMIFVLSMINSLLALYTKPNGGKCLIYIGREGPVGHQG
jgi:hypothetical protein